MSKISLIAKLTAAEGKADELRAALGAMITAADSESGLDDDYFAVKGETVPVSIVDRQSASSPPKYQ